MNKSSLIIIANTHSLFLYQFAKLIYTNLQIYQRLKIQNKNYYFSIKHFFYKFIFRGQQSIKGTNILLESNMFLQALRNKSNTQLTDRKSIIQAQPSVPSINSIEDKELDKKNEIFKKISVGIARAVLSQTHEEEQKSMQQMKEKQQLEMEKYNQNHKPSFGTKIYNNQLIKGITVTIEPLSKEQRTQAEQRRMINDVFSQVESISKLQGLKPSFTNLPQDNQKLPLLPINSPVSLKQTFLQRQGSLDHNSIKMAKHLMQANLMQQDLTQKSQQNQQIFGLTQQNQQGQYQQNQYQYQQQQQQQLQQVNQFSGNQQQQQNNYRKNNQFNPFGGPNQAQSQYQNQQSKKINAIKGQEQNSFDEDFNIEMPNYQRYRTFFFKPLERENMFEGMKYIQYEQYIRKDEQMQNVMVLDLTKILSDKCYTFKTCVADKNKMKRIFGSLRPQLKLEVNKRLEETISLFESISFLLMRDFRDNLQDVGIGESPLELHKEIRTQNLNIIFKNMHKNFYIEHVFNQIYDEEFQEKFMEQTLQEQYEILVTIKKNLKTLCEKIQQRIELYQNHQDIYQMQQFKLEDDSDFKEYLKSIESIIHQTKQLPSTQVVLEKKKNQKKPNKKKKLLDDSSFESNKSIEILYDVFRTKPIQTEAKEPSKNEMQVRRVGGSVLVQSQQQVQQPTVPTIQLVNTPQNQAGLVKQYQGEQTNQANTSQVQDSNQTPFRRKILRNFDSQQSTPQNQKPLIELTHADSSNMNNNEENKITNQKSLFQNQSNLMHSQQQQQNLQNFSQQQSQFNPNTPINNQQQQQQIQPQQQQQQLRNLQNTQTTKAQGQKKIEFLETNNKLMQEQHQPYKKMVIKDMGDEYLVFEDNLFLYEKTSDFMRDCIDSYRIMCRQKEFNKFEDYSLRKFLRYCTKVRFNISELVEQFRNYEKSIEQKFYWKSIMSKTMSSTMNFQSAQKYIFRTTTASSMQSPSKFQSQDSQENVHVESKKQRIGRLQSVLSDKFNFSKRQAQTRESKVELNNQKFEQEKQLLMDSHLAPEEVTHVIADNRRKLALQRLRNPFIEPFVLLINQNCQLIVQKIKIEKKALTPVKLILEEFKLERKFKSRKLTRSNVRRKQTKIRKQQDIYKQPVSMMVQLVFMYLFMVFLRQQMIDFSNTYQSFSKNQIYKQMNSIYVYFILICI
ncbi:hypothetical protein TTHERM_00713130 (macronuclear) [Tetrahymena thermophila SB210]|uniref:Uncharacterized protein n=1 Tax=Tetrahymena thermophila (strain SB210) TaxID=312017 RepID=Q24CY8_TETTS|nr:hypothetical protein TTHERM_00713130 [Tetrahymena thermophila SB210]EAS05620.3 hypothetical protein TTHERM_00713130 [Tetrahymena thermophila SB210]|eukprot:XP_001025865.3 hypothetical protein TTHERM_00713130 [Tetrahymena thermophila SB210]